MNGTLATSADSSFAAEQRGDILQRFRDLHMKPRPESGLDCLVCAMFVCARHGRLRPGVAR